jgi:Sulfotransferase domain
MYTGKIFCIGRNKTGTTSVEQALRDLGYRLGNQRAGELLVDDWARRDFRRIVELARTADAFQDIPFSLPFTYQALDVAFPGSKFILTVRGNPQAWYDSVVRFHGAIVGKSVPPRPEELKAFAYVQPGWLWKNQQLIYGISEATLYDRDIYTRHYVMHNLNAIDYFRYRRGQLLILDLGQPKAMEGLCEFLDVPFTGQSMPHLNRSQA